MCHDENPHSTFEAMMILICFRLFSFVIKAAIHRTVSSKKAKSWAEQSVLRKTRQDADNCLKRALRIVSALLKSTQAFQNFSSFFTDQNPQNLQRVTRPTKRQCRPCPFKVLSMPAFLKLSPTAKSLHSEYRRAYILAFDTLSVCGQI